MILNVVCEWKETSCFAMKQFVSSIYLKQKTDRKFILVKTTVYPELKAKFTTLTSVKCFLI